MCLLCSLVGFVPLPIHAQENVTTAQTTSQQRPTTDCSLDAYYANFAGMDVQSWSLAELQDLITRTHQIKLVRLGTTTDEEDIYTALRDIDAGNSTTEDAPTVHLLMRDIEFSATLRTPEGWTRDDLWPAKKSADPAVPGAGTDIHAKRPEDWETELELRGLFWGTCGIHQNLTACVVPAIQDKTAADTATDLKIKTPPVHVRGDVARSLLYMTIRYATDLGLRVSDCPPFAENEIGYLSELLEWHTADPVSGVEQARNDRICSYWQGNRNPLVDYPDLVPVLFGSPDVVPAGTTQYSQCTSPTSSPTAEPNECADLLPGDVQIVIWNSDPVDELVLFPVSRIVEGVGSIFVTDKAWNGEQFDPNSIEGTLEVRLCLLHP